MSTKRCTKCKQEKPLDEFYLSRHGTPQPMCAKCNNKAPRNLTRKRLILRRVRQRATAELVRRHSQELKELMEVFRPVVEAEFESVGADTTVRFLPGPAAPYEEKIDRIADPRCEHCSTHHEHGHACEACGQAPSAPVEVVDLTAGGQVRFKLGSRVVVRS